MDLKELNQIFDMIRGKNEEDSDFQKSIDALFEKTSSDGEAQAK